MFRSSSVISTSSETTAIEETPTEFTTILRRFPEFKLLIPKMSDSVKRILKEVERELVKKKLVRTATFRNKTIVKNDAKKELAEQKQFLREEQAINEALQRALSKLDGEYLRLKDSKNTFLARQRRQVLS